MSNKASSTLIGAFILGVLAIVIAALLFFGGGRLFRDSASLVMYFDRSIQGLELGAPMKLRGVKIGEVTRIETNVNEQSMNIVNAVYVRVRPEELKYNNSDNPYELLNKLVKDHGMRAQLRIQSMLTGLLYIEIDFMDQGSDIKYWGLDPDTQELPTARTEIEELSDLANRFDFDALSKNFRDVAQNLDDLTSDPELKALAGNLNRSVASITRFTDGLHTVLQGDASETMEQIKLLAEGLNRDYPAVADDLRQSMTSLREALGGVDGTLNSVNHLLSDDSPVLYDLRRALEKVSIAAENISALAETVEREPESLLKGKSSR
jgi:paraquat-inducible protein B